eukprot:scaffold295_cov257-Pinguiococcus_pyrenoidosus.AAC.4
MHVGLHQMLSLEVLADLQGWVVVFGVSSTLAHNMGDDRPRTSPQLFQRQRVLQHKLLVCACCWAFSLLVHIAALLASPTRVTTVVFLVLDAPASEVPRISNLLEREGGS